MLHYSNVVTDRYGKAIQGAMATVLTSSGTAASLFMDAAGSIAISNTLTTDANGSFSFYVTDGRYNILISGPGISTYIMQDVYISDNSSFANADGAARIGTKVTTGWALRTQQDKNSEYISIKDAGALGDGSTDDTTAINTCLSYAKLHGKKVFVPAGRYIISQIVVPGGIELFGVGLGHYGNSLANDNSVFWQKDGVNKDAVVFTANYDGTYYRIDPTYIHDLVIKKANSPTDTTGNGISFCDASGHHAMVNGDFIIQRVQIRGFPENGIYAKQGGTPCFFDTVDTLFNGGYGIRWDGEQNTADVVLKDCSGDGNKAGATLKIGSLTSNANFFIYNVYAEYVNANPYGVTTGFPAAQPYAIEIGDCASNSTVMIVGINGNSAYSTDAIDAAIFLNVADSSKKPFITWTGVSVKRAGYAGGNAYILKDAISSITIPYTCVDGCYSNNRFIGVNTASGRLGVGIAAPAAIDHVHVNTLSASRANANRYNTRDHSSGYFDLGLLSGSATGDWFVYADGSSTIIGSETSKPLDIYVNNSWAWRFETAKHFRPGADNTQNVGSASQRCAVIYAGTGTINTSDAREKQQIREISEAERAVGVKLKGLLKAFKFNNSVESKGDAARTHFGVIAQEVKAAFESEGLNAENYALLCHDEWEELPEIRDDDGRVIQEYQAAGNRYGIRYDELFAFMLTVA